MHFHGVHIHEGFFVLVLIVAVIVALVRHDPS